jgi:hypothetical protein
MWPVLLAEGISQPCDTPNVGEKQHALMLTSNVGNANADANQCIFDVACSMMMMPMHTG